MEEKLKSNQLKLLAEFLKDRRLNVLHEPNLLQFSYTTSFDNSKLAKIEKGTIDFQFSTFLEIIAGYRLEPNETAALLAMLASADKSKDRKRDK